MNLPESAEPTEPPGPTEPAPPGARTRFTPWIIGAVVVAVVLVVASVAITAAVLDDVDDRIEVSISGSDRSLIGPQRAGELAVEAVGEGQAVEIDFDVEDGRMVYEVEVRHGSNPTRETDVVVDARTGEILSTR